MWYSRTGTTEDFATTNWSGNWRMPTSDEFNELIENCTWTWTTLNSINGCEVKGKNGQSIFIPAAGYRGQANIAIGERGVYWSSTENTTFQNATYKAYSCLEFDATESPVLNWRVDSYLIRIRAVCP